MKIEDIELHVGHVDFPYRAVRELKAKCEASHAFMPAPTEIEINAKLRGMAAKVGANAVIDVRYNSGISITSWKSMTGTGMAVVRESDDVVCPHCAETIKRAAVKCRFCGEAVQAATSALATEETVTQENQTAIRNTPQQPPLEETNNPIWWMIAVGVFVVFMLVLSAAG
jgi:hypothetical protein